MRIYNKITWGGYAKDLVERDVISRLKNVESLGYKWDAQSVQLRQPINFHGLAEMSPWVHTDVQNDKRCGLDHHIIFNQFGIIPQKCMQCWKICCSIPDFDKLMKMKDMQKNNVEFCSSKCGIELRDYTPKHYGAYFYAGSFDEGRDFYKVLREMVNDEVGEDVGMILKRACTEFEMYKGPSPFWVLTPEEEDIISMIEHYVEMDSTNLKQPHILKENIMLKWFLWANSNDDFSYVPYNGGYTLFPDYIEYHEGNRDDIKKDMAVCRANAKHGVSVDTASELIALAVEFSEKNNIPRETFLNMATDGSNTIRLSDIPEELTGDHDELT
jgi:hypothetical protein